MYDGRAREEGGGGQAQIPANVMQALCLEDKQGRIRIFMPFVMIMVSGVFMQ